MAASICTDCPPPAELRQLIEGTLPPEDQSGLTAHLDSCESCQKAIEHLAAGGSGLLDCACSSEKIHPDRTSAYWPAIRRLEREMVKTPHGALAATRAQAEAEDFPRLEDDATLQFLDPPEEPGTVGKLGRFHVVEMIGRGGMGLVLRALDVCLQREVALKVLDPQYAKNDLARNRFIREARAAASISHDNVVAVHHVEKHHDEIPFLVMRLITGQSLQDRLDSQGGPLGVREILQIGQQTASGLAAAHEQTLIHRDIKPANILLESGTGKVLLTDFGLARAAEDVKLTQTGFVAGTPLYMSPEQARGETLDHRSDLFSLGSVLYAMCTGTPPFQGSSPYVVLREVTEGRHRPVRDINPSIPEELAAVIDHLLSKKPNDRIQSAAEVAELLGQILARLPVDRNGSNSKKRSSRTLPRLTGGWWRRHGGVVAAVVLGLNGLLLLSEATKLTHWTVIGQRGNEKQDNVPENDPSPRLTLDAKTGPIWSVAYSPDGETVAMAVDDGTVRFWDAKTGNTKTRIQAHNAAIWKLAYNHDGTVLATASDDGFVKLWDPQTNKELGRHDTLTPVRAIAFSTDGKRLATGGRNGQVRVWNIDDKWKMVSTDGHAGVVMSVAFSPDGKFLVSGGGDRLVKVWDVSGDEAKEVIAFSGHSGGVYSVAFHPTKRIVASGGWDRIIRIWDIDSGNLLHKMEGHRDDVWAVTFCCTGDVLASGSEDRTLKAWDVNTGKEFKTLNAHVGTIYSIAISPDRKTIATAGRDGTAKLWDIKKD